MDKWIMCHGSVEWVNPATLNNVDKVYDFLERRKKRCSISEISKGTAIHRTQVKECVRLLAYKSDPLVLISASNFKEKVVHQVKLIKKIKQNV